MKSKGLLIITKQFEKVTKRCLSDEKYNDWDKGIISKLKYNPKEII